MKKIVPLLSVVALAFASCSTPGAEPDTPIHFGTKSANVTFFNGNHTTNVTSEYDWTATTEEDWITLTKSSGGAGNSTLEFAFEHNPELEKRTGYIVVSATDGSYETQLAVVQEANDFFIEILRIGEVNLGMNPNPKTVYFKITPKDLSYVYYFGFVWKSEFENADSTVALMKSIHAQNTKYVEGIFDWSDFLITGKHTEERKGLDPAVGDWILLAFRADMEGNLLSEDITYVEFSTNVE